MILAPETEPPSPNTGFLDSLRAAAALFVLLHHAWLIVWPIGYREYPDAGLAESLTTWMSFGHFAVTAFLVISGFCLALPVVQGRWKGVRSFYFRRARRILPPFYAAIALTVILELVVIGRDTGTHWDASVPVDFGRLWSLPALVGSVVAPGMVNSVYWSIFVEAHIYLLFPAIVWLWSRASPWLALAGFSVAAYVGNALVERTPWAATFPHLLAAFMIGCIAAEIAFGKSWVSTRLRKSALWEPVGLALLLVVGVFLRPKSLVESNVLFPLLDIGVSVAVASFIVAGCAGSGRLVRALDRPLMRRIGLFSFSMYLMHFPLLQLVWQLGILPLNLSESGQFALLLATGTPLALLGSYGFFSLVERHFLASHARAR